MDDLRGALNRTASYDPQAQYDNNRAGIPLDPAAPWLQWGRGFYDGLVADAILSHFLGAEEAPAKSSEAVAFMEMQHSLKQILY